VAAPDLVEDVAHEEVVVLGERGSVHADNQLCSYI
jgi:hypothetical protein